MDAADQNDSTRNKPISTHGAQYITRLLPPTERPDDPVFVFPYGSGFLMDAGALTLPSPTLYHNLSSFFATCGYITVVPVYRLFKSSV